MIYEDPPGSGEYITGRDDMTPPTAWYVVTDTDAPSGDEIARRERLEAAWPDAPTTNLEILSMLLKVAKEQVIAFAPAPAEDEDWESSPPTRFVLAQIKQAENLWNAGRVSSGGNLGDGQFTFTPRPLDKTIQQIIRPVDRKPHVL